MNTYENLCYKYFILISFINERKSIVNKYKRGILNEKKSLSYKYKTH